MNEQTKLQHDSQSDPDDVVVRGDLLGGVNNAMPDVGDEPDRQQRPIAAAEPGMEPLVDFKGGRGDKLDHMRSPKPPSMKFLLPC
jgi:hypothetical protein